MDTHFNLSNACQSGMFFEGVKSTALEKLIDFSKSHTNITRCLGLPLVLCSSLFDLAQIVSTIGEFLIKGLANIVGSPFSDKCKFSKGVKQIFLQLPCHIISNVLWPLGTAFELLFTPIGMLFYPTNTLEEKQTIAEAKLVRMDIIVKDTSLDFRVNDTLFTVTNLRTTPLFISIQKLMYA